MFRISLTLAAGSVNLRETQKYSYEINFDSIPRF
ncbi:hypothetical protein SAMN04488104_100970 [Algoriphagus faecimaris]|uniref:Uncharacterized protein n=1 Tax=Algoriphagus faecimaris TaxID=686796 RepID=A0A1G6QHU3_9BACT|nr:hypothetical protein SAMN04488104_100970 [Algoriphagus faecimaris]